MSEANLQYVPTSDEVAMAALAHGSVVLSFLGPIGPVLVWISQRRKSAYASFHALQAMGYQMAFFWIGMALGLLLAIVWMLIAFPLMIATAQNDPENFAAPFIFEFVFILLMFVTFGVYFVGGIIGAVMCMLKKDFRYPWLGKRLETYLRFHPATGEMEEAMEERFAAAMSHASAILLMWGLLTPLAVWITQKEKSLYLRFQALQATVYQFGAVLGYFAFMFLYVMFFFVMFAALAFVGSTGADSGNSTMGILIVVFVFLMLLMWIVFLLALPTYHLFAMIAGIQILKGKDYRYPLLGNFLARRIQPEPRKDES